MFKLCIYLCGQSKHVTLSQSPAGFFCHLVFLKESHLLVCLLIYDCVLFIVFEKLFLEVIIDLDKDFSVAFARHLGSP